MKFIPHDIKHNNYYSNEYVGEYVYIKRTNKDMDIHQIFRIIGLDPNDHYTFIVEKFYYFCIPYDKNMKCFCYNGEDKCKYSYKDNMYILDIDEYLDTFREFVKNDGRLVSEVPSKIIQDKI